MKPLHPQMAEAWDIILTLRIAATGSDNPSSQIRSSWQIIRRRVQHAKNIRTFDGVAAQVLPLGAVLTLYRGFKGIIG